MRRATRGVIRRPRPRARRTSETESGRSLSDRSSCRSRLCIDDDLRRQRAEHIGTRIAQMLFDAARRGHASTWISLTRLPAAGRIRRHAGVDQMQRRRICAAGNRQRAAGCPLCAGLSTFAATRLDIRMRRRKRAIDEHQPRPAAYAASRIALAQRTRIDPACALGSDEFLLRQRAQRGLAVAPGFLARHARRAPPSSLEQRRRVISAPLRVRRACARRSMHSRVLRVCAPAMRRRFRRCGRRPARARNPARCNRAGADSA